MLNIIHYIHTLYFIFIFVSIMYMYIYIFICMYTCICICIFWKVLAHYYNNGFEKDIYFDKSITLQ